MTSFKRARSEEQRAERRRVILDTAADMLTEMPVAQVSLNELSRRVGLAKSNVLHYFESREAVLLDLLDSASRQWLARVAAEFDAAVDEAAPVAQRGDRFAALLTASLAGEPVLCDLIASQAAVLEHNVSPQVAAQFKRDAIANVGALARLCLDHLPELGETDSVRLAAATIMVIGAVWTHAHPSAAMVAVYESDPALAAMRLDFTSTLRETLEVLISGLLARRSQA
jgi:AcrR family transcriptional regulator